MVDFKEDTKQSLKEGLRERVESNTGIVGEALRARREQKEKEKLIQYEVDVIQKVTSKMKIGGTTLTNMEKSFTQISENLQLIAKTLNAQTTTFEETQEAYKSEQVQQRRKQQTTSGQKIPEDTEEVSLFERISSIIDNFERKRKKPTNNEKAKREAERKAKQRAEAERKELEKNKEKTRAKAESEAKAAKEKALKEGKTPKDAQKAAADAAKKVVKKANAATVKKVARKFILAKIGKAVVKTIPIIGTAVGVAFLVDSIWDAIKTNNYTKVGAEAAGLVPIVGGAASAIGGAAAETYMELYGTDYLTDKANGVEGADAAWAECNRIVAEELEKAVKETLKPRIQEARSKGFNEENDKLVAKFKAEKEKQEAAKRGQKVPGQEAPIPVSQPSVTTVPPPPAPARPSPTGPAQPAPAPSAPAPPPTPVAAPPMAAAGAPKAAGKPSKAPVTVSGGETAMEQALKEQGFDSTATAAIMAQTSHESMHFKIMQENLNYSASGLTSIFGKYFNPETAAQYAKQPEKIANKVYANRMGNGPEESGDGYKYRGRGFIQLTGKSNYTAAGQSLGLDLVNNPDLAADPKNAANIAIWFFKKNIKRITNWADTLQITKVVNGGTIGLADRQKEFESYIAKYTGGATAVSGTDASAGRELALKSTEVASAKKAQQAGSSVTVVAINNNTQTKVGATNRPPQSQTTAVVGA